MDPEQRKELLEKHAPLLRFDSLECLRPVTINGYLRRANVVPGGEGEEPHKASMKALEDPGDHETRLNPLPVDPGLNDDQRSSLLLDTFGGASNQEDTGTCYGRVVDDGSWVFLQYWFFYVDNPYVIGPGRHDGDWEMVQLGLRRRGNDLKASRLTFAQHGQGHTLKLPRGKDRPEVFVAVGSHAAYPNPGTQPRFPVADECDAGRQPVAPPKVVPLPVDEPDKDWRYWEGQWGMNRGIGTWISLHLGIGLPRGPLRWLNSKGIGDSPASPGKQGISWDNPRLFQGTGRVRVISMKARRGVHWLGKRTWPRGEPDVTVYRISDNAYSFTARPTGWFFQRITRVMVAFEDEETGKALGFHVLPVGRSIGRLEQAGSGQIAWRAAGYNFLCQRGNVTELKTATKPVEWPLNITGTEGADEGARRVFEGDLTNHLRRRGAATKQDLVGRRGLGWFWLRLNEVEAERVLEAARRDGFVCPLGQPRNAAGKPVKEDEWIQTDEGRNVELARAMSFRDSLVAARGVSAPAASGAEKWGKRAAAALVPLLPFLAEPVGVSTAVAVVVVGIVIALVLRAGIRGEVALRRAALRWPRLQTCRPRIYAWQTTAWRPWERLPVAGAVVIYALLAGAALKWPGGSSFNVWWALAVLAALVLLASLLLSRPWLRWRRLARDFREERDAVRRLRREEPDHPCAWGHSCQAARKGGEAASCPKFGPRRATL